MDCLAAPTPIIVGSAGSHWLVRWISPRLFRRVDPATAGTLGFLIRLFAMAAVVILALRIAGLTSSLGLFYATLVQGADRLQVPNSVLITLVVVPLREPPKVDLKARFSLEASPRRIEEQLLAAIRVPTRYPPSVSLEEVDEDGVVVRVSATPLRPDDGSQLAKEVLAALKPAHARSG